MILPEEIIILDLEYTAWQGSFERGYNLPNEHREIVQIAALKIETENLSEIDILSIIVKPRSSKEIAEKAIEILNKNNKRDYRKVLQKYNWKDISKKYLEVYNQIKR